MKNLILYSVITATFSFFPQSIMAQQTMDSSQIYIHSEKISFKASFFQKVAGMLGAKKLIEKKIVAEKVDQEVAPMHKSLKKNFEITETTKETRRIWTIKPKENVSKKVILYLHGGAYYWNISKYNWSFAEKLITKTNATLVMPDFPVAPEATCLEVLEYVHGVYDDLVNEYGSDNITIMGESSGGGLTLAFAMSLKSEDKPQPHQLVLLAPWLDVTMDNPKILDNDEQDKILGIKGLQIAGKGYAGQLPLDDYRVSPINGDLSNLPKISIFIGGHDLFLADSRKLKDQAQASNVAINYFEYPKMFHVWILVDKLKEAEPAIAQIVSLMDY